MGKPSASRQLLLGLALASVTACGAEADFAFIDETIARITTVRQGCLDALNSAGVVDFSSALTELATKPLPPQAQEQISEGRIEDWAFTLTAGTATVVAKRGVKFYDDSVWSIDTLTVTTAKRELYKLHYSDMNKAFSFEAPDRYLAELRIGLCTTDICGSAVPDLPEVSHCKAGGQELIIKSSYHSYGADGFTWHLYRNRAVTALSAGRRFDFSVVKDGQDFRVKACQGKNCDEQTTTSGSYAKQVDRLSFSVRELPFDFNMVGTLFGRLQELFD